MKIKVSQLKSLIREATMDKSKFEQVWNHHEEGAVSEASKKAIVSKTSSPKKKVKLTSNQIYALCASMDQSLDTTGHPEWEELRDQLNKLMTSNVKAAVVEIPVSDDWDDAIAEAIHDEVGNNDYGMSPERLIFKVSSDL